MFKAFSFRAVKNAPPVDKMERICKDTGKVEKLEHILTSNPDLATGINSIIFSSGSTPLCEAAKNNFTAVVSYLIRQTNVDINFSPPSTNETALLAAVASAGKGFNNSTALVLLNDSRINVQAINSDGDSALHIACRTGNSEIIEKLCQLGSMINLKNKVGQTPLMLAANANEGLDIVKFLVESCGAEVNLTDNNSNTALHMAYLAEHIDVAEYLVQSANADPTIVNNKNKTPEQCMKITSPLVKSFSSFRLMKSPSKRSSFSLGSKSLSLNSEARFLDSPGKLPSVEESSSKDIPVVSASSADASELDNLSETPAANSADIAVTAAINNAISPTIVIDDDLGIPLVDDGQTSPTAVNGDPEDTNPNSQSNSKTREGRVSFRTQSTENITYPGLQSEPLPSLPPNSTLLKTASYSKPRRKSNDKDMIVVTEDNLPVIGGVHSTSFSNLFSMGPPKQSNVSNNATNSNMSIINASTMGSGLQVDVSGSTSIGSSSANNSIASTSEPSHSWHSVSGDSMDSYGSSVHRFDDQTISLASLGGNSPSSAAGAAVTGKTGSKMKRPPPVITEGGSSTPTAGDAYSYVAMSTSLASKSKKRVHALKDDFVQSASISPHQLNGEFMYSNIDPDVDADYADEYPVVNYAELEVMEVCGVEMAIIENELIVIDPPQSQKLSNGLKTRSISSDEYGVEADSENGRVEALSPVKQTVTTVEDEPVMVPIVFSAPGTNGEQIRIVAKISSMKTVISKGDLTELVANEGQGIGPLSMPSSLSKTVTPQLSPNGATNSTDNPNSKPEESLQSFWQMEQSPSESLAQVAQNENPPDPPMSQLPDVSATKPPLPPGQPYSQQHQADDSITNTPQQPSTARRLFNSMAEPPMSDDTASESSDVVDSPIRSSRIGEDIGIDKVFDECDNPQLSVDFIEASPMQSTARISLGGGATEAVSSSSLDHSSHIHGSNILLYSRSGKANLNSAAVFSLKNKQHLQHLHSSSASATLSVAQKEHMRLAMMKLSPHVRKMKAIVQFAIALGRMQGSKQFSRKCNAFYRWIEFAQLESIEQEGFEFERENEAYDEHVAVLPAASLAKSVVYKQESVYLTATITSKFAKLFQVLEVHIRNNQANNRQRLYNAWCQLKSHKYVPPSKDFPYIPPSVRVVFKLNEAQLFILFCNYVVNRLDIPTNKQKAHTTKLLSIQQLWKMLKDFGIVPELCRKPRLLELADELQACDALKNAELTASYENLPKYKGATTNTASTANMSTPPSKRSSFHYVDPVPRKAITPGPANKQKLPNNIHNIRSSVYISSPALPSFPTKASSLGPKPTDVTNRRRNSLIAQMFSSDSPANRDATPNKRKSSDRSGSPDSSHESALLARLFGVNMLSELKPPPPALTANHHPAFPSTQGNCNTNNSIDAKRSNSPIQSTHAPLEPVVSEAALASLPHSDPRSLFAKPTPKKPTGPFIGYSKSMTSPALSYFDFLQILWRIILEGVDQPTLGPTSKSVHLLYILERSHGRLEMKKSCKFPVDVPPLLLSEITSAARARAILAHNYGIYN